MTDPVKSSASHTGVATMDWNYEELLIRKIFIDEEACIEFLREHRVLARREECTRCGAEMHLEDRARLIDGQVWRCPKRQCRTTVSMRKNSFFEQSRVRLHRLVLLIFHWCLDMKQKDLARISNISTQMVSRWVTLLRDLCSAEILRYEKRLGISEDCCIQIDETFLSRIKSCSNSQARRPKAVWCLGGVCSAHRSNFFIEIVPPYVGRTKEMLLEMIQRNVNVGTKIYKDSFSSYTDLRKHGYDHNMVNHRIEYIKALGLNTQLIENLWSRLKYFIKNRKGVQHSLLPAFLDEWYFRMRYRSHERFGALLRALARDPNYPVTL